jgi:hypothetical protein
MQPLTIFLRLIGLFALAFSVAMVLRRETFIVIASLLFILGLITLAIGLVMVLSHNIWSGGVLPVVITNFGWIQLFRGLVALLAPPDALAYLFDRMNFPKFLYGAIAITFVLGVYLTYMGFRRSWP